MTYQDRRVNRTHRLLREALVELIIERGWDQIRIQDLCDRADVGRSTFYKHFGDKEEVLLLGFDLLRTWVQSHAAQNDKNGHSFARTVALIEHVNGQRKTCRAMVSTNTSPAVRAPFRDLVVELVQQDLERLHPNRIIPSAAIYFLSGAFLELLTWWVESEDELSALELETIFRRFAMASSEALKK